jgi:hypothetical protein
MHNASQRRGSERRTSMGSTSSAMTTRLAFLASTRATTWLRPYLTKRGFLSSFLSAALSATLFSASLRSRAFFSCLDLKGGRERMSDQHESR